MIRVMTDNAANLPPELREQYGIRELCLTYTVNGVPADMSAPFDGYAYYEAMRKGAEVKTSMISPLTAREAMEPVLEQGDDVLYIGLSGGVTPVSRSSAASSSYSASHSLSEMTGLSST